MMQIITILICFVKKFLFAWADKRNLAKFAPHAEQTYQPPVNPEIETLKSRKVEIETTIEEFNTPSTFAKYSKMQRQLIKIDKQMQQLTARLEEESKVSRAQWEQRKEGEKKERESQLSSYKIKSLVVRVLINFTLVRLVHDYYTYPLYLAEEWPFSMLANDEGCIKCSFLMVVGNLLFQF